MRSASQFQGNRLRGFARVIVAVGGSCSIAWALFVYPILRHEIAFAAAAQHILKGEQYNAAQLSELRSALVANSASSFRPSALNDVAVVRLRLVEADLASRQGTVADLDDLQRSIDAALSHSPSSSFLWLAEYWLQGVRPGEGSADVRLLQMSEQTGPNEGWIAVKRLPLAFHVFRSLPADLKDRTLVEFTGLVRSGLYQEAANIVVRAGSPLNKTLVDGLASLDEGDRRRFAEVLKAKDIEGLSVPGVHQRRARPAPSFDVPR